MRTFITLLIMLSTISMTRAQQKLDMRSQQILTNIRLLQKQGASVAATWAKKHETRRKKGTTQE